MLREKNRQMRPELIWQNIATGVKMVFQESWCHFDSIIGLSFLFIETKELCEARAKLETSSNLADLG